MHCPKISRNFEAQKNRFHKCREFCSIDIKCPLQAGNYCWNFVYDKQIHKFWIGEDIRLNHRQVQGKMITKGGFFSESEIHFSNLSISQKNYSKKLS